MNLTTDGLKQLLARNPHITAGEPTDRPVLQNAKPERHTRVALPTASEGEKPHAGRLRIRITGYRVALLDDDNHSGGCKALTDCLRHSGLIPEDSRKEIKLVYDQIKVAHRWQEITVVEIEPMQPEEDKLGPYRNLGHLLTDHLNPKKPNERRKRRQAKT